MGLIEVFIYTKVIFCKGLISNGIRFNNLNPSRENILIKVVTVSNESREGWHIGKKYISTSLNPVRDGISVKRISPQFLIPLGIKYW